MRKGADCLSKWVGEAERQLRLLFEEARSNQPSIIFFDEIDGLAPVRSAKQDQIHASIVSTLLALMDGMDSRGEVVIIGATNRPDSIDPALRRPGRFDREFYFPLPSLKAREQILRIHTKSWTPLLTPDFIQELATLTKGYGGADLRALCTEAALIAVQRRYPQIYSSSERLVIDPDSITITPRDFTLAMKKLIPSSARSMTNAASQPPTHVRPLLHHNLVQIFSVIEMFLSSSIRKCPMTSTSDHIANESSFAKESRLELIQGIRSYRPRLLISGERGFGQEHIGPAILHRLESVFVQTIDIITVFGDPTATPESSLIRLITEARRRKPSVLFLPDIQGFFQNISDSVKSIFLSMVHSFGSLEPVLLLALANISFDGLEDDIRLLFQNTVPHHFELKLPSTEERFQFFSYLVSLIIRPPEDFTTPSIQNTRILEELAVAPPLRARSPTKAQKKATEVKDRKTKLMLKAKLSPLMELLRTKYKRFKKPHVDDKEIPHLLPGTQDVPVDIGNRDYEKTADGMILQKSTGKHFFNMDINLIEERLWNNLYLTPKQFQKDIEQILHDVQTENSDRDRMLKAQEMHTNVMIHLEEVCDSSFREECRRVAFREIERHQKHVEKQERAANQALNIDVSDHSAKGPDSARTNEVQESVVGLDELGTTRDDLANSRQTHAFRSGFFYENQHCNRSQPLSTIVGDDRAQPPLETNGINTQQASNVEATTEVNQALSTPCYPPQESFVQNELQTVRHNATTPYQCDQGRVEELQRAWATLSAGFSIEKLEQINSIAVDTFWQFHQESNRDHLADRVDGALRLAIGRQQEEYSPASI